MFAISVMAVAAVCGARAEGAASFDDTARFLAGIAPSGRSPLAPLARDAVWRTASARFNMGWRGLDQVQLPKIKAWSKKHLTASPSLVRYMFSGPDFIYADAFFSDAATYLLGGLEPVGEVPDVLALPAAERQPALACLRAPFHYFQNYGVFLTAELEATGKNCPFRGSLPLLLVALARAGKSIRAVEFVEIDRHGALLWRRSGDDGAHVKGVRIEFASRSGSVHTLYYFSTDLSNSGVSAGTGFTTFSARLGNGAGLLKAASYLPHQETFSQTRNFLIEQSTFIVQDDSGIPLKYFNPDKWLLRPFGDYRTPVRPFESYDQPDLRKLFRSAQPPPLEFGLGYRWRAEEANLLLAIRNGPTSAR